MQPEPRGTMKTKRLRPNDEGFVQAAGILSAGGLVAFPTETVYGLGADARNDEAVASIFEAKGRPSFNPLIVHVRDLDAAKELAEFNATALALADAFWPGPLSIVLPLKPGHGLSERVTAGLKTVALRVPANDVAQSLISAFGGPIAAPSANQSGATSPTRAFHVKSDLGGKIDAIINGGKCNVGLESSIVMPTEDAVYILRDGGVPQDAIERVVGKVSRKSDDQTTPQSPGQLLAHYAPKLPLRINVLEPEKDEYFISLDQMLPADEAATEDDRLLELARRLYEELHFAADNQALHGKNKIAVGPVPQRGIGVAINDRLKRAAHGS